jgi:hypothetical protein
VITECHPAFVDTPSDTFFLSGTGSPHHELLSFSLSSPSFIARFRSSFSFRPFLSTNKQLTSSLNLLTLATLHSLDSLSLGLNSAFATISQIHSAPNHVSLFGMESLVEQATALLTNWRMAAVATALPRLLLESLQRRHTSHNRLSLLCLLRHFLRRIDSRERGSSFQSLISPPLALLHYTARRVSIYTVSGTTGRTLRWTTAALLPSIGQCRRKLDFPYWQHG